MTHAARPTSDPTRRGNLATTPFVELLIALLDARKTGSLRIQRDPGVCDTVVRIEAGVPVGARMPGLGPTLMQSLIPLCTRSTGVYVFVDGQDDVGTGVGAVLGRVDPVTLIATAMRGPLREDAVLTTLAPLASVPLRVNPRARLERYGFTEQEQAVVDALVREPRALFELCMQPGMSEHLVRRVLYVLAVTRGLSPMAGARRMVSGTIEQVTPPDLDARPSAPPEASAFEGITSRQQAPTVGSYRVQHPVQAETRVTISGPAAARMQQRDADKSARATQAEVHRREAHRLLKRTEYASAAQQAQKALQLDGTARSEALFAFLLHLTCGDTSRVHSRVLHHLDRALQREPDCVEACFYKGLLLRQSGNDEDAARYFRRVLRLSPNHPEATSELRLWEARQAQPSLVSKLLNRLPSVRPKS